MHERKCDLCSAKVFAFSPRAAAELLEEHMEERHQTRMSPKPGEDPQLSKFDEGFLSSLRIGW